MRDGPLEVPLAELEHADTAIRLHQAEGVLDGLGHLQPLFGHGHPLRERANSARHQHNQVRERTGPARSSS